ncbi:MAG: L-seryl-tRNA(Sec) selenium transferase [Deltaproteobacteria bacterium]|jgi:L-seryl-tRNA(Ser) seleniumtransferase|nr:L-seryl-tRNA(Sec) selenium transferase [Deltaproteobacteria bacterium]
MSQGPPDILKSIPKVEKVLGWAAKVPELKGLSPARLLKSTRLVLNDIRTDILEKRRDQPPKDEDILAAVTKKALDLSRAQFRPVINATGVVLHTNLGRAPLAKEALDRVILTAQSYANLEYDPFLGQRADRLTPIIELLTNLTGAEAALAVNNNAAALFLLMTALAKDRKVVVSRGELVEIGGSFRLSDIIEAAGAQLLEIGSTNQTRLADYKKASLDPLVSVILKVHASNFRQTGYAGEVQIEELAKLGRERGLPVIADLGSGSFIDLEPLGLRETNVNEALKHGAEAICFSADKLFGGPQAGIILGSHHIVDQLKNHPLARTVRLDKMCLAALEATLLLAQDPKDAIGRIPVWRLLFKTSEELKAEARRLKRFLGPIPGLKLTVIPTQSQAGGGAAPEQNLPSFAVAIESLVNNVPLLEEKLRRQSAIVVARLKNDQLLLDVRTIDPKEYPALKESLTFAWNELVGQPVVIAD